MNLMKNLEIALVCAAVLIAVAGCGSDGPYPLAMAQGTVRYQDGSIPKGEVCVVRFHPILTAESKTSALRPSPSFGNIAESDGSFELTLGRPNSIGIPVGEHKVTFVIYKTAEGEESLIPEEYESPEKTPLRATVPPGGKTDFEFVIPKRSGV